MGLKILLMEINGRFAHKFPKLRTNKSDGDNYCNKSDGLLDISH